jgi:hypothetical protein
VAILTKEQKIASVGGMLDVWKEKKKRRVDPKKYSHID